MKLAFLVLAASLVVLAVPAVASAQECQSIPGRSALDQYCQAVPDGGGGQSVKGKPRPDRSVGDTTPSGTARKLRAAGSDGRVALALPAAVPAGASGTGGGDRGSGAASSGQGVGSGSDQGDDRRSRKGEGSRSDPGAGSGTGSEPGKSGASASSGASGVEAPVLAASAGSGDTFEPWTLILIGLGAAIVLGVLSYSRRRLSS